VTDDLARCDREIAEASAHTEAPAWLVTLGVEDWRAEKRLIEAERASSLQSSLVQHSPGWVVIFERPS